eukprot:7115787-Pyramimonas_sp.AAC.3
MTLAMPDVSAAHTSTPQAPSDLHVYSVAKPCGCQPSLWLLSPAHGACSQMVDSTSTQSRI